MAKNNKNNKNKNKNKPKTKDATIKPVATTTKSVNGNITRVSVEDTLNSNMLPYSLSVIENRAVPFVEDGLKPSSRFFLWGAKQAGADGQNTQKSAKIVGRVMDYNPHGDSSIYGAGCTMVDSALHYLTPYINGQGAFGKHFCSTEEPAASRYTEMKLSQLAKEIIEDSTKYHPSNIEMNYKGDQKQPKYLSAPFPAILANAQEGIAVGYACKFGSFNLRELCDATKIVVKGKKKADKDLYNEIKKVMPTMDFTTGAETCIDDEQLKSIYLNGQGQIMCRAIFEDDKKSRILIIKEIPFSANVESIMSAVLKAVDNGKLTEVSDIRNATGKNGFAMEIDYKTGTDVEELKKKLYALTPCQSSYPVNMNIIHNGKLEESIGVIGCIKKWIEHRTAWITEGLTEQKKEKEAYLNLLEGLAKILLDIDKAVKIVKNSKTDAETIAGLKKGFGLNDLQAEFVANIKLRNFNKEYILNKTKEIKDLKAAIADLQKRLKDIDTEIINDLDRVKKNYGIDRKTKIHEGKWAELPSFAKNTKEKPKLDGKSVLFYGADAVKRCPEDSGAKSPNGFKKDVVDNSGRILVFTNTEKVYSYVIGNIPNNNQIKIKDIKKIAKKMDAHEQVTLVAPLMKNKKILIIFNNGKAVKIPTTAWEITGEQTLKIFKKGICTKASVDFITVIEKEGVIDTGNGKFIDTNKIKEVGSKASNGTRFKFEK